jgi:hypothetical protein
MTAAEIVACVERLKMARCELLDGLSRVPLWKDYLSGGVISERCVHEYAVAAAHEARRLLRLTGEIPDGE